LLALSGIGVGLVVFLSIYCVVADDLEVVLVGLLVLDRRKYLFITSQSHTFTLFNHMVTTGNLFKNKRINYRFVY